jgi:hypothetical protein
MTASGLAAQPSQSLENIARGTRRSMGQFIPQYRTDGQYWIDHSGIFARLTRFAIDTCGGFSSPVPWPSSAMRRSTNKHPLLGRLMARRPTKLAAVVLANKIARIAWAIMARGERYREPALLLTA